MRDWENQASGRFCTYHKSALFISKLKSIIVCAGSAAAGDPIRKVSNLPTIADFGEKQKSEVKSVYNPQKQQEKQASEGPQPEESWCCWMEIVVCGGKRVWHKFRGSARELLARVVVRQGRIVAQLLLLIGQLSNCGKSREKVQWVIQGNW